MGTDHIPDEIKEEFNLPKDMKGKVVDFNEVRLRDAAVAIKHPTWSGQEVLSTSLSMGQS